MNRVPQDSPLIPNRLAATVAVILTGFVTAQAIREDILYPTKRPSWLLSPFPGMPQWVTVALNVLFYAYILWICFCFYRLAKGRERVVVAGWFLGFLLYPVERFASNLTATARYADATAMGIAFLAAFGIFLSFFAKDNAQAGTAKDS